MIKNILIIDAQKDILKITRKLLGINSYTLFSFEYFKIALKFYRLSYNEISIILLDMHLIDISHIETLPSLYSVNPDVMIIGISNSLQRNDIAPQYHNNIKAFLKNPFCSEDLLSGIGLCIA